MRLLKLIKEKKSTHLKVIHARGLLSWYKFKHNRLGEWISSKMLRYYMRKEINERNSKNSSKWI